MLRGNRICGCHGSTWIFGQQPFIGFITTSDLWPGVCHIRRRSINNVLISQSSNGMSRSSGELIPDRKAYGSPPHNHPTLPPSCLSVADMDDFRPLLSAYKFMNDIVPDCMSYILLIGESLRKQSGHHPVRYNP